MKAQMFDMTRMWAMVTGLVLAIWYFAALYLGLKISEMLPMLLTAIGGFEMFLYSQDVWLKRKSRNG
jgi:purine-cytosine permease-like protein